MQIINNTGAIIGEQINLGNIDNLNIDDLFKGNTKSSKMENKIKAEIVAHSKRANTGEEIITYRLTYPRIILSEVNTYKMIEKNTSSSRACPFEKMVEVVEKEPFIPIAWQKSHKGMQGTEYITDEKDIKLLNFKWLQSRDSAIESAYNIYNNGATKQLCNRLIEPFMWVTQLCTGTRESFEHLFDQRCPFYEVPYYINDLTEDDRKVQMELGGCSKKDIIKHIRENKLDTDVLAWDDLKWLQHNKGQAEIHFMDLAEKMYDALNESKPDILEDNEWHIPFSDRPEFTPEMTLKDKIILSCAMTARISYTKIGDENTLTIEKAREIYDKCVKQGHFSVVSHCAKCMTEYEHETWIKGKVEISEELNVLELDTEYQGYCKILRGFIPLRQFVEDDIKI